MMTKDEMATVFTKANTAEEMKEVQERQVLVREIVFDHVESCIM